VYRLTTNGQGEFVRPALKPSTYVVTISAPGFNKAEQKDVLLTAGERTGVNITLTVGNVDQTVEVTDTAGLLQTESTQVGAALNSKLVNDVPLGGQRNIAYLARLSPGVVPAEQGARDGANGGFSANGVRSNGQNNFLLNGVDNNVNTIDFLNQTAYAIGPSPDAVSEVSIQTNGYNAEYGRAAGGVVNVNLKSGSNAVHGSLFEYLQNKDLDSNTWTNNRAGTPRGPFVQNQFGATAGGPIRKNKLFIFGDYQGTRIADSGGSVTNLGYSGYTTIPTAAFKTGNFSSLLGPTYTATDVNGNPVTVQKGAIYTAARLPTKPIRWVSRYRCRVLSSQATSFRSAGSINPSLRSCSSTRTRTSRCSPATRLPTTITTTRPAAKTPIRATAVSTIVSATKTICSAH